MMLYLLTVLVAALHTGLEDISNVSWWCCAIFNLLLFWAHMADDSEPGLSGADTDENETYAQRSSRQNLRHALG